ncbi:kama family protein [Amniculicola lignicola CBS 123094]|uniref:Kama family protein n=1 Tax=Amniculicola lignicola CBS 123094 TaxID=1392246 RepID=A0A6A5X132_9PLEO|nr:kama family protein [Amniculicola lignicola CBS 123094]
MILNPQGRCHFPLSGSFPLGKRARVGRSMFFTKLTTRSVLRSISRPRLLVVSSRSPAKYASRQFGHLLEPSQTRAVQSTLPLGPHLYWQDILVWQDVTTDDFISWRWQLANTVRTPTKLARFLSAVLPDTLAPSHDPRLQHIKTKDSFIGDALNGIGESTMTISLTPHILSRINWHAALDDPIRRQFLPLKSEFVPDHEKLTLDSLHEEADSPVPGLVHRYPDKALFLATSICPVYCRFCTRSYAVGGDTKKVSKSRQKPSRRRWEIVFEYIEKTTELQDIVVSGGDTYYLQPEDIREIGERLLSIPHIKRFRFASKGLAVAPGRILDPHDTWTKALIDITNQGRQQGKHVCMHTHFNHPAEISWVTEEAAKKLFATGVIVRNQSVLLKGVNDSAEIMGGLIRKLSDLNIQPYYVYQCDLVRGIEDLRTPLQTILDIEQQLRGTIAGFMMPSFVVDLPEGGGKRLAAAKETYENGVSTFKAPGLLGEKGERTYTYWDPAVQESLTLRTDNPTIVSENEDVLLPVTDPRAQETEQLVIGDMSNTNTNTNTDTQYFEEPSAQAAAAG